MLPKAQRQPRRLHRRRDLRSARLARREGEANGRQAHLPVQTVGVGQQLPGRVQRRGEMKSLLESHGRVLVWGYGSVGVWGLSSPTLPYSHTPTLNNMAFQI